ncbi:SufD family Fe-S cluster assembly protein [Patescibacteria group bacterium]
MKNITLYKKENKLFIDKSSGDEVYKFKLSEKSNLTAVILVTDSINIRLSFNLSGRESVANVYILVKSGLDNKYNISTFQNHQASSSSSRLYVKGVLTGKSYLEYNGVIRVDKDTRKTDAYQRNENLLLSDGSKVKSSPSLEILADEVKCTHGAFTAPPNEDQIFYLETRGVNREKAVGLISKGFILSMLDHIENPQMHNQVSQELHNWV